MYRAVFRICRRRTGSKAERRTSFWFLFFRNQDYGFLVRRDHDAVESPHRNRDAFCPGHFPVLGIYLDGHVDANDSVLTNCLHLLSKDEAIALQQQALELEVKKGMKGAAIKEALEKMKAGKEL
jgi:hypothetical protein